MDRGGHSFEASRASDGLDDVESLFLEGRKGTDWGSVTKKMPFDTYNPSSYRHAYFVPTHKWSKITQIFAGLGQGAGGSRFPSASPVRKSGQAGMEGKKATPKRRGKK